MNFSGSGTLCVVSFESLMEFQMLDGWLDAAPQRTPDNLQQTGILASSRLKMSPEVEELSTTDGRTTGKFTTCTESENRSYCFARMAFPTQIQCISNTCRNANPGNENGAHDEAGAHLVHQRKKADPA